MKFSLNTFLIFLLLMSFQKVNAQKNGISSDSEDSFSKHRIGLAAGTTSGVGILYAYKPNRFAIQAVAFPNIQKNQAYLQAGLSFQYDVKKYSYFDLFAFANNRLIYRMRQYEDYSYDWTTDTYTYIGMVRNEDYLLAHAAGMGLRFDLLKHFGMNVMSGFAVYNYEQVSMTIDAGIYFIL